MPLRQKFPDMKQKLFTLFLFVALATPISNVLQAQGMWTWIKGPDALVDENLQGPIGVASNSATPGGRDGAVTWQDANGNLWFFGGSSALGYHNDLWKYTPSTNQWIWLKGDSIPDQLGVYGTLGVASSSNVPGARGYASGWTDANGNLWLFGGDGWDNFASGFLNDLWRYNISTNQWTWMGGTNIAFDAGNYGTLATPSSNNIPPARVGGVAWTDASGNFWLFGGYGTSGFFNFGGLNDLWKYTPSTGLWTWMKGLNGVGGTATYGTLNTPSANNTPGARALCQVWKATSTDLWLFGGVEPDNGDFYNDLWKYNLSSGNWTWVGGSNTINQVSTYGTLGVPASTNMPSSRAGGITWTDNNGHLWLLNGQGVDSNSNLDMLNDQWSYNPANGEWAWMMGTTQSAVGGLYGTLGTPSATNMPGSRSLSASWYTSSNQLYLYGGSGFESTPTFGGLSDMWRFGVCVAPASPTIVSQPTSLCGNQTLTLTANAGTNTVVWYATASSTVSLGSGTTFIATLPNTSSATTISFYAEAFSCGASASRSSVSMTVIPGPTLSVANGTICEGQSFTLTPSGASSYTFSSGNAVVQPITTSIYTINGSNGNCVGSVQATVEVNALPSLSITASNTLLCIGENNTVTLQASGATTYTWSTASNNATIMITPTVSGTYSVVGEDNGCQTTQTIALTVICAGLNDVQLADLVTLYPNPVNDKLFIQAKDVELTKGAIFNNQGSLIMTIDFAETPTIDTNQLAAGIYFITLTNNSGGKAHIKFVKE